MLHAFRPGEISPGLSHAVRLCWSAVFLHSAYDACSNMDRRRASCPDTALRRRRSDHM